MQSIVGIFNSLADAEANWSNFNSLGIAEDKISVLSPHTPETEIEAVIPTTEAEQPGMGRALGGAVGGALGVAGSACRRRARKYFDPRGRTGPRNWINRRRIIRGWRCGCGCFGRRRPGEGN